MATRKPYWTPDLPLLHTFLAEQEGHYLDLGVRALVRDDLARCYKTAVAVLQHPRLSVLIPAMQGSARTPRRYRTPPAAGIGYIGAHGTQHPLSYPPRGALHASMVGQLVSTGVADGELVGGIAPMGDYTLPVARLSLSRSKEPAPSGSPLFVRPQVAVWVASFEAKYGEIPCRATMRLIHAMARCHTFWPQAVAWRLSGMNLAFLVRWDCQLEVLLMLATCMQGALGEPTDHTRALACWLGDIAQHLCCTADARELVLQPEARSELLRTLCPEVAAGRALWPEPEVLPSRVQPELFMWRRS